MTTIGVEQRTNPVDGVAGLAHRQADRISGFEKLFGGREISIPVPAIDLRRIPFGFVGRKHLAQIDPGMVLVEVETRAAWLDLAA
jgi:hypothetical protein